MPLTFFGLNSSIAWTVFTVFTVLLILYLLAQNLGKSEDSHDTLAGLMLYLTERKSLPIWFWFWIWVVLSLVIGVVSPWILLDKNILGNWLLKPHGLFFTLNYTFLVPFLVWAYLELLRATRLFFQSENLSDLGLSFNEKLSNCYLFQSAKRNQLSQISLLFVTCIVMACAMYGVLPSEENVKGLTEECLLSPWVKNSSLTWAGYLYYSIVRGLGAYLAGGQAFLVFGLLYVFYFGLDNLGFDRFLEGDLANFKLKLSISQLSKRLSVCLFLSALVVAFHGLALAKKYSECNTESLDLIWGIWGGWTVVVSIIAIFLLHVAWRFNLKIKEAVVEKMQQYVESLWKKEKQSLDSYNAKIEVLTKINAYARSVGKFSNVRESLLFVVLTLLLQALTIFVKINE